MPTPLILIKHDWTSPVVERIEFLTSVLVSANKREQRAGKRQFPRRGYEMQYLLSGEKLHEFRAMLSQSTARQAEVPLWHMGCQIIGYNAFTNVLTLDRPYGFKIGTTTRLLILYQDGSYQVVTAAGFTDQTNLILSLSVPVDPVGARFYPLMLAYYNPVTTLRDLTAGVSRVSLQLLEVIAPYYGYSPLSPVGVHPIPDLVHDDLEVLARQQDWAAEQQTEYGIASYENDYGWGTFTITPLSAAPYMQGVISVKAKGRDNIVWWQSFIERRRGKQIPFILPHWRAEFKVLSTPSGSGFDFYIEGQDWLDNMNIDHRPYIAVKHQDGRVTIHTISAMVGHSGNTGVICTTSPWSEVYGPEASVMISFASRARLQEDMMEIQYVTDEYGSLSLPYLTVEV